MSKFVEETMFRWVNGASTDGIFVFEPCNDGVQFFVRCELQKGPPQEGEHGVCTMTGILYHSFQLDLLNFIRSYFIIFLILQAVAITTGHGG